MWESELELLDAGSSPPINLRGFLLFHAILRGSVKETHAAHIRESTGSSPALATLEKD